MNENDSHASLLKRWGHGTLNRSERVRPTGTVALASDVSGHVLTGYWAGYVAGR